MTEPVLIDPKVADAAEPAEAAPPEGASTSIRSLMTLGLAVVALAFLGWMIVLHPEHQNLFGPSPAPLAVAAVHAPPPGHS